MHVPPQPPEGGGLDGGGDDGGGDDGGGDDDGCDGLLGVWVAGVDGVDVGADGVLDTAGAGGAGGPARLSVPSVWTRIPVASNAVVA